MDERIRAWLAEVWPATVERLTPSERYAVARMLPRVLAGAAGPRLTGEPDAAVAVLAALLGARVRLEPRVQRVVIQPEDRSRVGAPTCRLGRTWALGTEAAVVGTHWAVVIGPLSPDREHVLFAREWRVPDGPDEVHPHPRLRALASALFPAWITYEWIVRRRRPPAPRWVLGRAGLGAGSVLGVTARAHR
jgi:hypothetical protein